MDPAESDGREIDVASIDVLQGAGADTSEKLRFHDSSHRFSELNAAPCDSGTTAIQSAHCRDGEQTDEESFKGLRRRRFGNVVGASPGIYRPDRRTRLRILPQGRDGTHDELQFRYHGAVSRNAIRDRRRLLPKSVPEGQQRRLRAFAGFS